MKNEIKEYLLWIVFQFLARTSVYLFLEFGKLAGNMSSVAVQHRGITRVNLTRVVEDNNLQNSKVR